MSPNKDLYFFTIAFSILSVRSLNSYGYFDFKLKSNAKHGNTLIIYYATSKYSKPNIFVNNNKNLSAKSVNPVPNKLYIFP